MSSFTSQNDFPRFCDIDHAAEAAFARWQAAVQRIDPGDLLAEIYDLHAGNPYPEEPRAYYRPLTDTVNMPRPELFDGPEEYYSTLFHELTHSTGYERRLHRQTLTDLCPFGSTNYSKEELVAEIGAAFLCGLSGIENRTIDNSAAYVASWLRVLRNDKQMVVLAAAQAQRAADFIQGVTYQD